MTLDVVSFLGSAAVNLAAVLLIVAGIYYPRSRNRDYFFSFVAFNTVIDFVMVPRIASSLASMPWSSFAGVLHLGGACCVGP